MHMSKRAKRMERRISKGKAGALNLVSLMDIFTILVFFLLVNSSEQEVLDNNKSVQVPESVAETRPRETVIVMVTPEYLLVQGEQVATLQEIEDASGTTIEPLKAALQSQVDRLIFQDGEDNLAAREVTIVGDKTIPYSVLKKVMSTCSEANYGQISLAVLRKGAEPGVET